MTISNELVDFLPIINELIEKADKVSIIAMALERGFLGKYSDLELLIDDALVFLDLAGVEYISDYGTKVQEILGGIK